MKSTKVLLSPIFFLGVALTASSAEALTQQPPTQLISQDFVLLAQNRFQGQKPAPGACQTNWSSWFVWYIGTDGICRVEAKRSENEAVKRAAELSRLTSVLSVGYYRY